MLDFKIEKDANGQKYLLTSVSGKALMSIAQLNKGTAFTQEERLQFGLLGKLPNHVETLEEQMIRAYWQYCHYNEQINKNIYLNYLLNQNQVLFYKLIETHIEEMLPTIYTPIVGNAVKEYNEQFMQPRGLYISYDDQDQIEKILNCRSNPDVKLIVVSDGEGVLGIGDQGVGAMAIPIAKLMVYSAIGHINPDNTLPILLDAGTNNESLLNSPFYLGWKHKRISGSDYDRFIDKFINAVKRVFPHIYLHWEDFGRHNAYNNLIIYREKICSFNDDIQGTGVVTTAAILAAISQTKLSLAEQRIIVFGAGSAGIGITETLHKALIRAGLTSEQARKQFWLIDRQGLLTELVQDPTPAQLPYLRSAAEIANWSVVNSSHITLEETIAQAKPTILIGTSALPGAFSFGAIQTMAHFCEQPIILPLSNPPERSEAHPQDLIAWTQGKALIATGSPFDPVEYQGQVFPISQCNNYLSFPGIGLGVISVEANMVTDNMLWAASQALSEYGDAREKRILPTIQQAASLVSRYVAIAVAKAAIQDQVARKNDLTRVEEYIDESIWKPEYLPYRRT